MTKITLAKIGEQEVIFQHNPQFFSSAKEAFEYCHQIYCLILEEAENFKPESLVKAFYTAATDPHVCGNAYSSTNTFECEDFSVFNVISSEEAEPFYDKENGLVCYLVMTVEDLFIYFTSNYIFTQQGDTKTIYYFD